MFEVEDHIESGQASVLEVILLGQVEPDEAVLTLPDRTSKSVRAPNV